MEDIIEIYFDGASKGNPGSAGAACWIINKDKQYGKYKYLNEQTNNYAEYSGLIMGLNEVKTQTDKKIKVYGDSKLVIEQMKGKWQVKSDNLINLYIEAKEITSKLNIEFIHIDRKLNEKADNLANIAVKTKQIGTV